MMRGHRRGYLCGAGVEVPDGGVSLEGETEHFVSVVSEIPE